jgi:hypothetical protein
LLRFGHLRLCFRFSGVEMRDSVIVEREKMTKLEHAAVQREAEETIRRIASLLKSLEDEFGTKPTSSLARGTFIIADRQRNGRHQVYLPGFGVAGEGDCVCEAVADALSQFASLLQVAADAHDLSVLPPRDRSIKTFLRAIVARIKFSIALWLHTRLHKNDDVDSYEGLRSAVKSLARA